MTEPQISPFDVAEMLDSPEVIAEFLNQRNDPSNVDSLLAAFATSIRAVGIEKISERTGIGQTEVMKIFEQGGDPSLEHTMAVTEALGLKLTVRKIPENSNPENSIE